MTSTQPMPIRTGTMVSKAADGSHSSSNAPAMPPRSEAVPNQSTRRRSPVSSRPVAHAPESEPGVSPTVLEMLAITGGTPSASRVGKVIKVPEPTTVLINPAAAPATSSATRSSQVTGSGSAGSPAHTGRSGWPRRGTARVCRTLLEALDAPVLGPPELPPEPNAARLPPLRRSAFRPLSARRSWAVG